LPRNLNKFGKPNKLIKLLVIRLRICHLSAGEILTQLSKRREEQTTVEGQLVQAKCSEQKLSQLGCWDDLVKATRGPVQAGEELLSILPNDEELC